MGLKEDFEAAAYQSKQLTEKPTSEELLQLYGLYKVACNDDFSSAPKPSTFDFKGKYKYGSWEKYVNEGLTVEDAQKQYIELVEKLKVTYKFDPNKVPESVGDN